jgi:23S rRNA (cytosine1962-C5)-methyltransferase
LTFESQQYQLLDFGAGRRLERLGAIVLDRPCPTAEGFRQTDPAAWQHADARFDRPEGQQGTWTCRRELPERWTIAHGRLVLEIKRTLFGHVGVFAEQADNWDWIAAKASDAEHPVRVLNLFAYTGGSTLAAATAGAEVTHVDAAKNIVAWARRNAELAGLAKAPIRWIAEDALKFVKREIRRGNRYDAVIMDPPSYGHGPNGEPWQLPKHLPRLLQMCAELTDPRPRFMLLTCHTPGFTPGRLGEMMGDAFGEGCVEARGLVLHTAAGRELPSGVAARWERRGA